MVTKRTDSMRTGGLISVQASSRSLNSHQKYASFKEHMTVCHPVPLCSRGRSTERGCHLFPSLPLPGVPDTCLAPRGFPQSCIVPRIQKALKVGVDEGMKPIELYQRVSSQTPSIRKFNSKSIRRMCRDQCWLFSTDSS